MAKYDLGLSVPRNNAEYPKLWARAFRKKHPDKALEIQSRYRKVNPLKYLFGLARRRAKAKGIPFTITPEDLGQVPTICPLLGIPIDSFHTEQKYHPSIDRIDSTKGYVSGNVMIISHRANMLKNNSTAEELLLLANNLLLLGGQGGNKR